MSNETKIRNDSVEQYAIEIRNDSDQQAVRIKSDGSIIFGEGFTVDSAAREFWLQIGKLFPTMFVPVDNLSALDEALMDCGHPKACLQPLSQGALTLAVIDPRTFAPGVQIQFCTVCAELARLKALMECGHPNACLNIYHEFAPGEPGGTRSDMFCTICAELSRREAEAKARAKEVDENNAKYFGKMSRREAEARAGCAALLESAADNHVPERHWDNKHEIVICECGTVFEEMHEWQDHIRALIPTDAAAALADLLRDARYKSTSHSHGCYFCGKQGIGKDRHLVLLCDEHVNIHAALADEKRKARLEEAEMWHKHHGKVMDHGMDCPQCRRIAELRAEKGAADGIKKL